jgi:hypothetical protein
MKMKRCARKRRSDHPDIHFGCLRVEHACYTRRDNVCAENASLENIQRFTCDRCLNAPFRHERLHELAYVHIYAARAALVHDLERGSDTGWVRPKAVQQTFAAEEICNGARHEWRLPTCALPDDQRLPVGIVAVENLGSQLVCADLRSSGSLGVNRVDEDRPADRNTLN